MAYKDPEAARERSRRYYEQNREREIQRRREHYQRNSEKERATQRAYRERNREAINARKREQAQQPEEKRKTSERQRGYYEQNRDHIIEYQRGYRERNREKISERERRNYKPERNRISRLLRTHGMRPEDWAAMWDAQHGLCYLCTEPLTVEEAAVDHDHSCCGPKRSCRACWRGLAHNNCNFAIGLASDSPARLRCMADALEQAQARVTEHRRAKQDQFSLL